MLEHVILKMDNVSILQCFFLRGKSAIFSQKFAMYPSLFAYVLYLWSTILRQMSISACTMLHFTYMLFLVNEKKCPAICPHIANKMQIRMSVKWREGQELRHFHLLETQRLVWGFIWFMFEAFLNFRVKTQH